MNRAPSVVVDSFSGLAGIAFWVNNYFGLKGDEKITKQDELCAKIKLLVDAEYATGRSTMMSNRELCKMFASVDEARYNNLSERQSKKV